MRPSGRRIIVGMSEISSERVREAPLPKAGTSECEEDLALAHAGDNGAFTRLVGPLRDELRAHCYRMLGSVHDADDALQDALLRAWRHLPGFQGRSSLRSWLYTVATRTCLDLLQHRRRRALPMDLGPASGRAVTDDAPATHVAWLGPYPGLGGEGLDRKPGDARQVLNSTTVGPEVRYEQRESVELAMVAALQHLSPNQRAVLLLVEVLGFTAAEIAGTMKTSVTAVNSTLARARRTVSTRVPERSQQQTLRCLGDAAVERIVTDFAAALERGDSHALVAMLTEDVTWSMPPLPRWYSGLAAVTDFAVTVPLAGCGDWRHLPTVANGQPAIAFYLRAQPDAIFAAWSITVLTLREHRISDITSFLGAEHFPPFGLPSALGIHP